jgi:deoxyribonuclease-4
MSATALGAHVSTAGGLARVFERGREISATALQIFVKNASQWRGKPLADEEVRAFRAARAGEEAQPVVAHAAYLINLAAPDEAILAKSRAALADELGRCAALGVDALVVHPGAHMGRGVEAGIDAVAASLDAVFGELPEAGPALLLELTAGQGTVLGHTLGQLAAMRSRTARNGRVGFCLDTCHAFAAGYDVGSAAAVEDFLAAAERELGLASIGCVHVNDSVGELGSRKDRHANIGEGKIGLAGFRRLLGEQALASTPFVLETPMGDDERGHARDLARLRELLAG